MKKVFETTITSVFIMPTLGIDRESLHKNKFKNAYLGDVNKEEYFEEDVVFLVFKPDDIDEFRKFIESEYENTSILEDYDYDGGYIVLVYNLNEKYKSDFNLIKQSKYSKVSEKFKKIFPKEVKNYQIKNKEQYLPSIQHLIFNKDPQLIEFFEEEFNVKINPKETEVWKGFCEKLEILDIEVIIEKDNYENNERSD